MIKINGKSVRDFIAQDIEPLRIQFESQPHKIKAKLKKINRRIRETSGYLYAKEMDERWEFNRDHLEP